MKIPLSLFTTSIGLALVVLPSHVKADSSTNNFWQYTLLPESQLTDDCDICGRPTIIARLGGTFELQPLGCDLLSCQYAWAKVSLSAAAGTGMTYFLEGEGIF